ncbi:thioredoxin-dependent thiol peroxidase [Simiduia agarivorans]|uniref:thioredoxin-dependent peroxiredoxin n=1 Tax=Simiduia agarivorans (strain DSM 21679 / JCM 13881 / BCRC 17597 / SA1) TaxID=1117647 RepID=K4KIX5_SIMAS|nr:thioredoxin-dependent thiol peroxidase [Simiduia agarivorans]AFU97928.1 putative bacterioferritin comigratory protein [Simiduia agarivorans SA1 = DSM 21679]
MSYPKIGNLAPAFSLKNHKGEKVSLKDFRGKKVVLFFYPKALTPGCTTQACGMRDSQQMLADANTVVLGLSPDPVEKLQKFVDKHQLNFDLLSDEDHKIADKYGVWGMKKFMGREFMGLIRTSFVVDEAGKLSHIVDKFKTSNHHDVIAELLAE